ncbi:MAG: hypothetical protein RIR48_3251, partial [Bacteroidota bacterium]
SADLSLNMSFNCFDMAKLAAVCEWKFDVDQDII